MWVAVGGGVKEPRGQAPRVAVAQAAGTAVVGLEGGAADVAEAEPEWREAARAA